MTENTIKASDCPCCVKGCTQQGFAFWPCIDPDIKSYPYCKAHLDEAQLKLMIELSDQDIKLK